MVLYLILNLMSPQGIDVPKTASVLGYCMLPLVVLSSLSTLIELKYVAVSVQFGSRCGAGERHDCTNAIPDSLLL